jgi:hypothetical protein
MLVDFEATRIRFARRLNNLNGKGEDQMIKYSESAPAAQGWRVSKLAAAANREGEGIEGFSPLPVGPVTARR